MNNLGRNIAIWLVIGVALMALFNLFQSPGSTQSANKIAYSDFIASARNGGITEVLIEGNNLKGRTRENTTVISYMPDGADVVSMLADTDVRIDARPDESNMPGFLSVLISWFPMLLF
ncbi:MAG: ATP-dependent metallopeptidase FtsH/Yme1/Tma family protein, partial [Candidatus Puniceispirillaceae bacterium]